MTQHNDFITNDFAKLTKLVGNQTRKVAHNTTIRYNEGLTCFEVVYHWSTVVRIWSDNSISLYNNGWTTPTTKERLNWYARLLGWTIYQENFEWFAWQFDKKAKMSELFEVVNEVEFYNGLHIGNDGELIEEEQEQAWQDAKYRMP